MKLARPSKRALLAILLIFSVGLALGGPKLAGRLRAMAHLLIAPLGDPGMYAATKWKAHFARATSDEPTPAEARRFRKDNEALEARLIAMERKYRQLYQQMARAKEIHQGFRPTRDFPYALIPARVTAGDSLPYGSTRLLNAGRSTKAKLGDAVTTRMLLTDRGAAIPNRLAAITSTALVGRLVETAEFSARLQLVTDEDFSAPGQIIRRIDTENPRQIAVTTGPDPAVEFLTPRNNAPIDVTFIGDGAGGLLVREVPVGHKVLSGDWLVTKDDEPRLPLRIAVGRVTEVADDAEHRAVVTLHVTPLENLAALREVYIIVPLALSR